MIALISSEWREQ